MNYVWQLRIYDPRGNGKSVQQMGTVRIDGHPVMELEGNGNCRDASFMGDAGTLGIGARDRVGIEWSEDGGGSFRSRYVGIAVENGSPQEQRVSSYKLTGLMKKMEEAEARLTLPKGDLFDQAQQLITDTINSGQWDSLISTVVVRDNVPPLTSNVVVPNYQSVAAVFKEVLCKRLAGARVAVNGEGQVLFGVPGGVMLIDEATPGVLVEWQEVTSEELLTFVRFQWSTGTAGIFSLSIPGVNNGFGVPIETGSPPLFTQLISTSVLSGDTGGYAGQSTRSEGVPLDVSDFDHVGGTYVLDAYGGGVTTTGDQTALRDGNPATTLRLTAPFPGNFVHGFVISVEMNGGYPPDGILIRAAEAQPQGLSFRIYRGGTLLGDIYHPGGPAHASGIQLLPDAVRAAIVALNGNRIVIGMALEVGTGHDLTLQAFTPVMVGYNISVAAAAMKRAPAASAASVTVPGWPDPQPTVQIQRRGPAGEALEIVTLPGALFRYEVGGVIRPGDDTAVALQTSVQLGQPDTAQSLGLAALIKARDRAAVLKAISAAS